MKLLAFGGSTSSTSINRQLANHAASLVDGAQVTELDLREFDLPIFSADLEDAQGVPADALRFLGMVRDHDAVVVSLAEHNGSYAAAFKNLLDWASRAEQKLWGGKPMLLLSTSPGGRGGATVRAAAETTFPHLGADIRATFSLPKFYDHFDPARGVTDPDMAAELARATRQLAHPAESA